MENEIWLPIRYGNGKKDVSNFGNIRNAVTKCVLKSYISKHNGYAHISFHINKEVGSKTFKVHRLVAEVFLIPVEHKTHVNHKDFNKLNNHVDNLEWCNMQENIQHYYREKFNHIVTDEVVKFIRENIGIVTPTKLAKQLNLGVGYVYGVANGIHHPNIYPELIRDKRTSFPRVVIKLDKEGNKIAEYKSISEAAKQNNAKIGHIQRVLSGERKSINGFIYKCDGYKQVTEAQLVKRNERLLKLKAKFNNPHN